MNPNSDHSKSVKSEQVNFAQVRISHYAARSIFLCIFAENIKNVQLWNLRRN